MLSPLRLQNAAVTPCYLHCQTKSFNHPLLRCRCEKPTLIGVAAANSRHCKVPLTTSQCCCKTIIISVEEQTLRILNLLRLETGEI